MSNVRITTQGDQDSIIALAARAGTQKHLVDLRIGNRIYSIKAKDAILWGQDLISLGTEALPPEAPKSATNPNPQEGDTAVGEVVPTNDEIADTEPDHEFEIG